MAVTDTHAQPIRRRRISEHFFRHPGGLLVKSENGEIDMTPRIFRMLTAAVATLVVATGLLSQPSAQAATGLPELRLPFAAGLTDFTSGPHTWDGTATGNRGSVDFGSPDGSEQRVYAAAGGTAYVYNDLGWSRCYVIINHGNGWQTAYYHLKNVPSNLHGKIVKAGEHVGDMGAVGVDTCGGGTPGYRHVHFVLLNQWKEYPINGVSMGGYTVHEAPGAYCGTWTRNKDGAVVAQSLTLLPPSSTWPEGRCARMEPGLTNDQQTQAASEVIATPAGGTYGPATTITLSTTDPGSTIYYTTDGTTPTTASAKYSTPIPMASMTLKYFSVNASGVSSPVGSQTYVRDATAPTVTATPAPGTYPAGTTVTLASNESGAIYYTVDGSTPTTSSTRYTGPITLQGALSLKAIAVDNYGNTSTVSSFTYQVQASEPGVTLNLVPQSGPAMSRVAVVRTSSRTVSFGIGTDKALYMRRGDGAWGVVPNSQPAKDVAAYANPDGRVGFFYITTTGAMYSSWENSVGGSLASWVSRGSGWTSVATTGRTQTGWHMFATNTSGVVYRLSPYDGVSSATAFGSASGFTKVSAATDGQGRVAVLAVKADGQLYQRTQSVAGGSFSSWTAVSGTAADMALVADPTKGWVIYRIDPASKLFVGSGSAGWQPVTLSDASFVPQRIAASMNGSGVLSVLALNTSTGLMQGTPTAAP